MEVLSVRLLSSFSSALLAVLLLCLPAAVAPLGKSSDQVSFAQSAKVVEAYDYIEVTLNVAAPKVANPFTDVQVTGEFRRPGAEPIEVQGFCDAPDGSVFRIRFMPTAPGRYTYSVKYQEGDRVQQTHTGSFSARDGKRRGLVRVDPKYPWHFIWEGTGEHYFWNSNTTYALMGWKDDAVIRQAIDRQAALKVNRLRVAIIPPRVASGQQWYEPSVLTTDKFTFRLNAWVAARPDALEDPAPDVTRFNLPHWQKYERLLRYAREKGMVISVIFYVDGRVPGVDPFKKAGAGGADEQRYYAYAAARFAAFSNVMWDVTNEYRLFRDDAWAEKMGSFLKKVDPYDHLTSIHGHGDFRFMRSPWADFAMYQAWDEHGGNAFILKNRALQEKTGRIMPQINEEYGYEDHYPGPWGEGRKWPTRTADTRRRLAWEMYMAGGYQTTGERADGGTGAGSDTGGGWINGRGDEMMTMLVGYKHTVDFFTSIEWWKKNPRNDLIDVPAAREESSSALCLAELGRQYVIYLPRGESATVKLEPGRYRASWFNPRSGKRTTIAAPVEGQTWTSPVAEDKGDWVLLLQRIEARSSNAPLSNPTFTAEALEVGRRSIISLRLVDGDYMYQSFKFLLLN